MGVKSKVPTHRLYVYYKNGTGISKTYTCISSALFYGVDYMKKHNVSEIRVIKLEIKP